MPDEVQSNTQLRDDEPHPSAHKAYLWFHQSVVDDPIRYVQAKEAIASTAIEGNRLSQVCLETMNRLENGQPVSDRYLLGLCWFLRDLYEGKYEKPIEAAPAPATSDAENLPTKPLHTKKRTKPAKKNKK